MTHPKTDRSLLAHRSLLTVALLIATAALAYHNSFGGPFVLDDIMGVRDNPTIHSLWPLWGPLAPIPGGLTVSGRPILNLSFAINYAISGTDVWSYHAANLLIHLLAGLALLGIVRRTLERLAYPHAASLAAIVALAWVAHPLQTESVTYVVQRAESLMGLLYLCTLYAVVRGAQSPRPWRWYAAGIAACALGMGVKEVMVTAPLVVLLYDRAFLAGSFAGAWRARRAFYCALAATWLPLAWLVALTGNRDGSAGFGVGLPWWQYAANQFEAVTRYLWLAVWPRPLVFDYGAITAPGIGHVLPYALFVLALLAVTVVGLVRNRAWAFLGACFFLILAPTTSILPNDRQTFAEHRMYLPLAAVVTALVLALFALLKRRERVVLGMGAVWIAALCWGTVLRNDDYRSDELLYAGVVAHYPDSAYGQFGYAMALLERGENGQALAHLDSAVRLKPDEKSFRINRAYALLRLNRPAEAAREYEAGFRLGPVTEDVQLGYAAALVAAGRTAQGLQFFADYGRAHQQDAAGQFTVGQLLVEVGRPAEAIPYLERARSLAPDATNVTAAIEHARQAAAAAGR